MADLSVKAETFKLSKILADIDKFYQIPDYQRPYSWDKDNIAELINDLSNSFVDNRDEEYYCGSLVLAKNDKSGRFDVIDGQQRLTTFVILACVIRDLHFEILGQKQKDFIMASIIDKYDENKEKLKFLTHTRFIIPFQNTFIDKKLDFDESIKNIEKQFKDNRYLQNAYYIKSELSNFLHENQINDFVEWLYDKVLLTEIICSDESSAIRIFNVLNNRGMPLNSTDILKSRLMQRINDDERKSFEQIWQSIEENLQSHSHSLYDMLNTYLYFLIAKNPKKRLDEELLTTNEFKNDKPSKIIGDIENFSKRYINLLKQKDRHINCLKYLPNANKIYWVSILVTAEYTSYKECNELKNIIMAYYYQNFIAGLTVNQIKQTSFKILEAIRQKKELGEIKYIILENIKKNNTTQKYNQALISNQVFGYKWVKPILLLIEYFGLDRPDYEFIEINSYLHLEHILPQTLPNEKDYPEDYEYWKDRFDEDAVKEWTNSLANLTLLRYRKNIQAQNFSFPKKKQIYSEKDKEKTSFTTTQELLNETDWDIDTLNNRQKKIVARVKELIDIF